MTRNKIGLDSGQSTFHASSKPYHGQPGGCTAFGTLLHSQFVTLFQSDLGDQPPRSQQSTSQQTRIPAYLPPPLVLIGCQRACPSKLSARSIYQVINPFYLPGYQPVHQSARTSQRRRDATNQRNPANKCVTLSCNRCTMGNAAGSFRLHCRELRHSKRVCL